MKYEYPFVYPTFASATLIAGNGTPKNNHSCPESSSTNTSSAGAYEVDE
jgi:hypothetical protein